MGIKLPRTSYTWFKSSNIGLHSGIATQYRLWKHSGLTDHKSSRNELKSVWTLSWWKNTVLNPLWVETMATNSGSRPLWCHFGMIPMVLDHRMGMFFSGENQALRFVGNNWKKKKKHQIKWTRYLHNKCKVCRQPKERERKKRKNRNEWDIQTYKTLEK